MSYLRQESTDVCLTWTIDRPERRNAIGTTIAGELRQALDDLQERLKPWRDDPKKSDPPHRVLVITANPHVTGDKRTFIAGGDLKELKELDDPTEYAGGLAEFCRELERLPLPVIVAIDGDTIGGGVEVALAGDFRIATRSSSLQFKQMRIGLAMGYGSTKRLVDLVGPARAKELLFLCQSLNPDAAMALGLIHRIVGGPEGMARTLRDITECFTRLEPMAIAAQKTMLYNATMPAQTVLQAELAEFKRLWRNPTHAEFLDGF